MCVLLVTWLTYNQPPASYQTVFPDQVTCEEAVGKLIREGERLRIESDAYYQRIHPLAPSIPPEVVAICARQ